MSAIHQVGFNVQEMNKYIGGIDNGSKISVVYTTSVRKVCQDKCLEPHLTFTDVCLDLVFVTDNKEASGCRCVYNKLLAITEDTDYILYEDGDLDT